MERDVAKWIQEFDELLCNAGALRSVMSFIDGYEVCGYEIRRADAQVILISAGIHGDEPAGPLALLDLIRSGLLDLPYTWLICPVLNPSGLKRGTRENCRGVDMNRDYFLKDSIETQGHVGWLEAQRKKHAVQLFISLHEDWESSGFYFYEINCVNDNSDRARELIEKVSRIMPIEPSLNIDGHNVRDRGWIYHRAEADIPDGWPEAIFAAKMGCPLSFTLETPSSLDLELRVRTHSEAVRSLIELCFEEERMSSLEQCEE